MDLISLTAAGYIEFALLAIVLFILTRRMLKKRLMNPIIKNGIALIAAVLLTGAAMFLIALAGMH